MIGDPNVELLTCMATALGELCEKVVFVGGCATGLLITDTGASPVRMTHDVDAIVAVVSLPLYHALGDALTAKGFSQPLNEGDPPYRWILADMKLDLMPLDPAVLGFSNRWYEMALQTAEKIGLREGLTIRLVTPPCFIATKLEAFLDRGLGDYLSSHDLEDVLSVVDGRPELVGELAVAEASLRSFVSSTFARLLGDEDFLNALPGLIVEGSPQGRTAIVLGRLHEIARIGAQ